MIKMKKMTEKLVKVVWYDSFADSSGWYCKEDIKYVESVRCESVGYLLEDNDRELKLCHTMSESDLVMGKLVIPKGMIREVKELR